MNSSIRLRLAAWHGLVLLVVLAGFGTTAYEAAWRDQLLRVDQELSAQLDLVLKSEGEVRDRREPGPGRPAPQDPFVAEIRSRIGTNIREFSSRNRDTRQTLYVVFLDSDGTLFARSETAPPGIPAVNAGDRARPAQSLIPNTIAKTEWRTRDRWREAYRVLPLGDAVLAGVSLDEPMAAMKQRGLIFGAAGLLLWLLGVAGGWWLTGRALQPIQEISRSATVIAAGDLKERISLRRATSELSELADVLNSTFSRLEAAFSRQTRFTSDASHELRTPIAVILSKTQTTLLRERSPAEYQEALRVCQRSAYRMRDLTEALLQLSRGDQDLMIAGRERVELDALVREAAASLDVLAQEKNLRMDLSLEPVATRADAGQIAQVLTNLLSNAVKYSAHDGVVHVRCRRHGDQAVLEVQDHGAGISAKHLPHVFERFYRGDPSRTGGANFGLGLSIAKTIVEAHRGHIDVESDEGNGARFTVWLPVSEALNRDSGYVGTRIC